MRIIDAHIHRGESTKLGLKSLEKILSRLVFKEQ